MNFVLPGSELLKAALIEEIEKPLTTEEIKAVEVFKETSQACSQALHQQVGGKPITQAEVIEKLASHFASRGFSETPNNQYLRACLRIKQHFVCKI
ncbi:MAG: hypothetical protein SNF33_00540 [Candidatus Algichlamydia australiensis]|nr:hypothetical protein [Chlamydiales bacterium]